MANINITIRMDEELRKEADALFEELGLSLTSAINAFVRQAVREGRIPFELTTRPQIPHEPAGKQSISYAFVELPDEN